MTPVTRAGASPIAHDADDAGSARSPLPLVAGLDLGSTNLKALVVDRAGHEVVSHQVATPWRVGAGGTTELTAEALLTAVGNLLATTARRLADVTPAPVGAIGIAGMGETGMLVDEAGAATGPAYAWYDPRGGEAGFPQRIHEEFSGRTGLPLGAQVTVAKLAHLRDLGQDLSNRRWLNLPEFVATALGGRPAREHSLSARTGLIDQDTGLPWPDMLQALGVGDDFLPPAVDAGTPLGRAAHVPPAFVGAVVTVAGHDHLVAAEASGPLPADHYYVSMGTAEVLLRVIDAPLGYEARARLAQHLINEVQHVVPGKRVLVAGVKTGLLLSRALRAAGIHDRAARDRLDDEVTGLPYEGALAEGTIEVAGARNDDGVLRLAVHGDGATPAEVFGAVLRHSNDEISTLIDAMDRELPPARSATLTGGWSGMASVRRARARVLPAMSVTDREQETVYGAAMTASHLLSPPTLESR